VALLLAPWVGALVLKLVRPHYDLDVTIPVSVSLGLPLIWLAWVTYRGPRGTQGGLSVAQVADQLAIAVGAQWEVEAALRRLNDPYPLPVSWTAADRSLTDPWGSLVTLASSGAGWPAPLRADTWATGPDGLAGQRGDLVKVLGRVPTGRLAVLGEPGAGKTMLMVRLVLDMLACRSAGGPVPILASLASWNPADQDLRDWLGIQLMIDHPALAAAPPEGRREPTQAAALLASGLVLPLLDGLDEIPEEVRGSAISRINDALRPGEPVVVTCRSQQFRNAIRPENGMEVTLRGAAAIQLLPLDADVVRGYLCDDVAGPVAKARWDAVLALLGTPAPAGQALETPLMVSLARTIYNPRPGELAGALRDPAELCNPALADRTAVESLLFDAFIPAAYRDNITGRCKAQDHEKWLVFLARHLERTIVGPDLAWWELRLAVPDLATGFGFVAGVIVGLIGGILGGVSFGIAIGLIGGGAAWLGLRKPRKPSRGIHWQPPSRDWPSLGIPAMGGAVIGVLAGVRAGAAVGAISAVGGYAVGVSWMWLLEQQGAPLDLSSAASPPAALARDRKAALVRGVLTGLGILAIWVLEAWISDLAHHETVSKAIAGAAYLLVSVAVVTLAASFTIAWPNYVIARASLALLRRLPWRFMGFLADAHRRGILRQAGAVYQFRHIELQHRLATRAGESTAVNEDVGDSAIP
jgi:NACHT domain